MEYGTVIDNSCLEGAQLDNNLLRHAGWYRTRGGESYNSETNGSVYEQLFSNKTIAALTASINAELQGIGPDGQNVEVTPNAVAGLMSTIFNDTKRAVGDIHSRYIIDSENCRNDVQLVIDRTREVIVSGLQNQFGAIKCNNQLSIWDAALMGDFNRHGLRQTPKIKLRERHPEYMQFHMRY